jgi:hypothetical protein
VITPIAVIPYASISWTMGSEDGKNIGAINGTRKVYNAIS